MGSIEKNITIGSAIYQIIEDESWVPKHELKDMIERTVLYVNSQNARGSSHHTTLLEILTNIN